MKSMTAFARKEWKQKIGYLSWEIRSVNNRYLDMNFRVPDMFRELEPIFRERVNKYLSRGKVDCSLRYQPGVNSNIHISVNDLLLSQLMEVSEKVYKKFAKNNVTIDLVDLLRYPGVIDTSEVSTENIQLAAVNLFDKALIALNQAREQEGRSLKRFLEQRLRKIDAGVKKIRQLMPKVIKAQREKLITRCRELSVEMEPNRLEQEVTLLTQRLDIHEELDRLQAHVVEVKRVMSIKESCGRRLDFLMQELNRESNTIASKSVNKTVTHAAVELKVLIEEMREQIQNIE